METSRTLPRIAKAVGGAVVTALCLVAAVPAPVSGTAAADPAGTAAAAVHDARIDEVARFFAKLHSLKARFVEIRADGSRHEGVFFWQRPGRFRFAYTDGTPLLIVSDGRQVSLVDEDAGSVTRWPVGETALAPLLVKAPDAHTIARAIRAVHDGPLARLFWAEVADPAHPERGTALLLFSRSDEGLAWLGWRVSDGRDGRIEVRLFDTQENPPIAEEAWTFKDPRRSLRRKRRGM